MPNKFLDSRPNFVENWGGWEVLIFIFQVASKNSAVLFNIHVVVFNVKYSKMEISMVLLLYFIPDKM